MREVDSSLSSPLYTTIDYPERLIIMYYLLRYISLN